MKEFTQKTMPQEIIVTSVPRGLDGGSGFQTVKRTRGMPLAVAERLHQRSGYTHRFPAGDKRNPVVVSCRIERLRKGVYHVLSLTKDAGTDHSGRQNRLAHLIAFDEADVFEKQAGPAPVAKKLRDARIFLDSWNQQPHESEAPVVISPRAEPGVCTAWRAAGFDPGLAGEIAASAIAGKRSVVIVSPETDVVSLFTDAMLLMPPDARWRTTFTTSGSGNDDYIWQAVRADLPEAEAARNLPGVIDLTKSPSAADGPYVDFARSGKGTLPWQQPAVPEESTSVDPDPGSVATDSSAPDLNVPAPDAPEYVPPVGGSMPPALTQTGAGAVPQLQTAVPKKRKLSDVSPFQPKEKSKPQPNPIKRNLTLGAVACVFLIVIGMAVVFSPNIIKISSRTTNPSGVNQVDKGDTPPSGDKPLITDAKIKEHEQKQQEEVAKEEERLADEQMAADQKKENAAEAEKKRLAAERMAADQEKKDAASAANRQRLAFEQLVNLPDAVSLVKGIESTSVSEPQTVPILIGRLAIDLLVDFELALATPKGAELKLVESEADGNRSWVIETMVSDLDAGKKQKTLAEIYFKKGDSKEVKNELFIQPASTDVAKLKEYKFLLRSALLLFAKEPKGINKAVADKGGKKPRSEKEKSPKRKQIKLPKQINLVEATRGQSDSVIIVKNQNTVDIGLGVPQILMSDSGNQTLSIDDLITDIEVISPCTLGGDTQETSISVKHEMEVGEQPEDRKAYSVPLLKGKGFGPKKEILYVLKLFVEFGENQLGCNMKPELVNFASFEKQLFERDFQSFVTKFGDDKKFKKEKDKQIKIQEVALRKLYLLKIVGSQQNNICVLLRSHVEKGVLDDVFAERSIKNFEDWFQNNVLGEIKEAVRGVPETIQQFSKSGAAVGIPQRNPQLEHLREIAANGVLSKNLKPLIESIINKAKQKYDQRMNEWRNSILPLVNEPTKIRVKKIHTEAFHDGEQYQIVLVDENAEQVPGKSGSTKPTSLD